MGCSRNADVVANGGTNSDCHRVALFARLVRERRSLHSVEPCLDSLPRPWPEPFVAIQIAGTLLTRRFGTYGTLTTGVF
jgi:hypothetical protein